MNKENQYYSVIKSIVEQHKKYVGLEAIIDDIIDDVYSHSEIILKSIANESVIDAYLAKVVSTSIITVPKKMNFHPEIKHRNIVVKEPAEDKYTKVDNTLVDKMINTSEVKTEECTNFTTPEMMEETTGANSDLSLISIEPDKQTEILENNLLSEQKNDAPEEIAEEVSLILEEPQPVKEEYKKVDNSLVDMMINSSEKFETVDFVDESSDYPPEANEAKLFDNELQEEVIEQNINVVQDDIISFEEEEELIEEISSLDIENVESNEEDDEAIYNDTLEEVPSLIFSNEAEIEDNETEEGIEEPESLITEDLSLSSDDDFNDIQPEFTESIEEIVEVENVIEENEFLLESNEEISGDILENEIEEQSEDEVFDNELTLFGNNESEMDVEIDDSLLIETSDLHEVDENLSLDNSLNEETDDEVVELVIADDTQEEAGVSNFKPVDYSNFGYVPDIGNKDLDISLIAKDLKDLDEKKPELDIIDIYNLKYKENLQISQIASKLDVSENLVIEALNEIIAVI